MLAALALCAQAQLPPAAEPRPAPALSAAQLLADWQGGLRHAQLVAVREGEPPTAVVATVFGARSRAASGEGSCIALHALPLGLARAGAEATLGGGDLEGSDPLATLVVPELVLPLWTWHARPAWRVLDHGGRHFAVTHDAAAGRVHLRPFDGAGPRAAWDGCDVLWDATVAGDELRVLVSQPGALTLLTIDLGRGDAPAVATPVGADDGTGAAGFVAGTDGAIVLARRTATGVVLTERGPGPAEPVATRAVALDGLTTARIGRLAARRGDHGTTVALGPFEGARGWPCVALVPPTGAARLLHPYGATPDRDWDRSASGSGYGQALAVLLDLDGDGASEALVSESWAPLSERVELHLTGRQAAAVQLAGACGSIGSCLSVDAGGRYALTAGPERTYPELFDRPGYARLLRVAPGPEPTLVEVGAWRCQGPLAEAAARRR